MLLVWLALPVAVFWARRQERRILREGRPLTEDERRDAEDAGVADADAVRLLTPDVVPTPGGAFLRGLTRWTGVLPAGSPAGMALGHGIYLDRKVVAAFRPTDVRAILVHECVHVAQYERLGGIRPFLSRYLKECVRDGYHASAMEAEANETADRVCHWEG